MDVAGTRDHFRVHRIYCVGRNYAKNVRLDFFNKPVDAAYTEGSELPYPMATENLNHEIELVVTIGKNGTNLSESEALDYVFGYAVWLDVTRRDRQGEANKK